MQPCMSLLHLKLLLPALYYIAMQNSESAKSNAALAPPGYGSIPTPEQSQQYTIVPTLHQEHQAPAAG